MKKILALVLALAMILAVSAAFAGTITITPPTGVDANAKNTYTVYKVFDAVGDGTNISYKLVEGKSTAPAGFSVDSYGNVSYTGSGTNNELTAEDIAAIKSYVTSADVVDTVTVTGTTSAVTKDLPDGYYFIDTTTGTTVTIDSVNNANQNVNDKNTVPGLTKEITGASGTIEYMDEKGKKAISEIGTDVEFKSVITVGKGMKDYVFHDTMGTGLALKADSITITYSAKPDDYVEASPVTAKVEGKDTITINFNNGLAEGTKITIQYKATVTNEALTTVPEKNTAYVEYGNGPTHGKTPEEETETYSAKISVIKKDGKNTDDANDDTALPGAKFKLYRLVGEEGSKTKEYYKYDSANKDVIWTTEANADERTTDANGTFDPFIGLNDGTYYLTESFVPSGFNAIADVEVVIAGKNYTAANLEQEKTVINNAGVELPHTGGIGTTIFYILGGLLVVGAAVILVARRKAQD